MIYRLDDLIESNDFEHDQKFVKAEHWKDACDELEDKSKTVLWLQAENAKLRGCVESFVDKYFDLPVELRMKKDLKEEKESLRARQVLKELDENL